MTDINPITQRKVSVTFERKVSDGDYGSITARSWVEGNVADDANEQQVREALQSLFMPAVVAVLEQLGIEFGIDPDTQVVQETAKPITQRTEAPRDNGGNGGNGGGNTGGHGISVKNPADQDGPLPQWLLNDLARDGITAIFDNRKTATGNQPIFKEAVPRGGVGHGSEGKAKGYWPPK